MKKTVIAAILLVACAGAQAAKRPGAVPNETEVVITWNGETAYLAGTLTRFHDQTIELDGSTIGTLGYQPLPDVDVTRLTVDNTWHIVSTVYGRFREDWTGLCAAETFERDEGNAIVRYVFLNCATLDFGG